MKRKILIASACVLVAVIGFAAFKISKMPRKNVSGWEVTEAGIDDASWGSEIESATDYHVEKVSKKEYQDMTQVEYIDTAASILNTYTDKIWTLFLFEDGTGIKYPGSDIMQTAFYGKFDDNYKMTEQLGTVSIEGREVTYEPVSDNESTATFNLSQAIPDEYENDSTFTLDKGNMALIDVLVPSGTDAVTAANNIIESVEKVKKYDEIRMSITHDQIVTYYRWKDANLEEITLPDDDFLAGLDTEKTEE